MPLLRYGSAADAVAKPPREDREMNGANERSQYTPHSARWALCLGLATAVCGPQLAAEPEAEGALDCVLVMDASPSMQSHLVETRDALNGFLTALSEGCAEAGVQLNVGTVTFRTHTDEGWLEASPLAAGAEQIREVAWVPEPPEQAGEDDEELEPAPDLYAAMDHALGCQVGDEDTADIGWRERATKVIVAVTDAPPADPDWEGRTAATTVAHAKREGEVRLCALIPANTEPALRRRARRLAGDTNGVVASAADAEGLAAGLVGTVTTETVHEKRESWRAHTPPLALYGTAGGIYGLLWLLALGVLLRSYRAVRAQSRLESQETGPAQSQ